MSSANVSVVQGQLDAYNAQDLDAYCAFFSNDCVIADLNGNVTPDGLAAIRTRYGRLFADFPQNRARLINRVAVGDVVIDHEDVARAPGNGFKCAAIYTLENGLIARVDFVREP